MVRRTAIAATLLACGVIAAPARADVAAPEAAILRQVAETYRNLQTYLFEGDLHVVVKGAGKPQIQDAPFFVAAAPGGRLRDEVRNPTMGGMIVSDGKQTTIYNGALRQYVLRPGPVDSVMANVPNRGIAGVLIARYAGIAGGALSAKRLPNAPVTLDGAPRDCIVLEVAYPPTLNNPAIQELPRTYWIDTATHLVLRQSSPLKADLPQLGGKVEQQEDVTFQRALVDPKLPDSLWVFRPPDSARAVAQFTAAHEADPDNAFTGKPALEFTLKDLKGQSHALKSLRGKVVLLDFWATWCGPCRLTMPQVAKIHTEFKNRGVEVMSINIGEPAMKAGDYMKKNGYLFTTLLDIDRDVATLYKVNSIPTLIVIDRKGNVSDYLIGARDDVALRAALRKAGVD